MINKKIIHIFIFLSAAIASIGTYPYAKNFAVHIFSSSPGVFLGTSLFVPAAIFANIALGAFSIKDSLKLTKKTPLARFILIGTIALFASLSTGFICMVGYYETLSLRVNILISVMVTLVNSAISFSAVHNASSHFFNGKPGKNSSGKLKKILVCLTMVVAFFVSFVFYLATADGLLSIIDHFSLFAGYQNLIAYLFSILVWLPSGTLFVNASRITVTELYDTCYDKKFSFSWIGLIILIIAIFSGSAFAQMTLEFFDSSKKIPEVFQIVTTHQSLVAYGVMPISFIISALVNAYALNNVFKK